MTEKELIRRAMMGDKQAQEECTEKGVLLPCPFCGGKIKIDEYDFYMFCCDRCGTGVTFAKEMDDGTAEECTKEESIKNWNTRPAPPVGRCGECRHCVGVGKNQALRCTLNSFGVEFGLDFITSESFCSYFEPREESR